MPDLIAQFDAALAPSVADPLFRRWGGLVLTSALLGRHVWTSISEGRPLYPHLFVALVANSGYGKSTTITAVREALVEWTKAPQPPAPANALPSIALAAKSITLPRLVRAVGQYFPDVPSQMNSLRARCYAVMADEIAGLLGDRVSIYDLQLLAMLWDLDPEFSKQTNYHEAKGKETKAREHYVTLTVGAQPAWIAEALPLSRFQLGLPARVHFVLGTTPTPPKISQGGAGNWADNIRRALEPAMRDVSKALGYMPWANTALAALDMWTQQSHAERGKFGALFEGYGVRRHEHAAKLALLFACARVHNQIELDDWESASLLMEDTEKLLPEVLALVGANPQRPREDQIVDWVRQQGETREADVRAYMRNFIDTRMIGPTLDELTHAGLLINTTPDWVSPRRRFKAP